LDGLGAGHFEMRRLAGAALPISLLGLDARYNKTKGICHALRLFCRLLKGLLQRFGGGSQSTLLSFCSLCHVAFSITVI
jgi:hypothetical protein